MDISPEAKKVLEVIIEENEKNPSIRLKGIPERVVGAKAGIYLDNPIYEIAELEDAGFVRKLGRNRILITQDGQNYIRPPIRKTFQLLGDHPIITISIIVGIIGIIVTLVAILR